MKPRHFWALLIGTCAITARAEPPTTSASAPIADVRPDNLFDRASAGMDNLMNSGFQYLGIRYRFGGTTAEKGFDCSGLVRRVFKDALGFDLPRTAREMAGRGEQIPRDDLKPGDLVFFKTMRHAFSHVGIYVGDNRFLHSPSAGGRVRIDDMNDSYWRGRFNGARRMVDDAAPTSSAADNRMH